MEHPSRVPTNASKSKEANVYSGKNPYGLVTKKELDWVKGTRSKLGQGSYGSVYKYENSPYGMVAVKFMEHNGEIHNSIVREISMLIAIQHPNVINILDIFFDSESIAIVLPLATTALDNVVKKREIPASEMIPAIQLTEKVADSIIYQIARGMMAIQDHNILNGDYKSPNILLLNTERCLLVKIADFGLAQLDRCFDVKQETNLFTIFYRPPEFLLDQLGYTTNRLRIDFENLKERSELVKRYKGTKIPSKYGKPTQKNPKRGIPLTEDEKKYYKRLKEYFISERDKDEENIIYTRKSDSWTLGCIIFEVLSGKILFPYHDRKSLLETIFSRVGYPDLEFMRKTKYYYTIEAVEFDKEYNEHITQRSKGNTGPLGRSLETYLDDRTIIKEEYRKYIPILLSLLRFKPEERIDIREVASNPLFNYLLSDVLKCLRYDTVKERTDTNICLEYLIKYEYPIVKGDIFNKFFNHRVILYEWMMDVVLGEYNIDERDIAIAIACLELFVDRDLLESAKYNVKSVWEKGKYQLYSAAAIQLATSFDDRNILIDDLLYVSGDSLKKKDIFTAALTIFAAVDFNMVRSTAYDIFIAYSHEFSDIVRKVGKVLLKFSYMTSVYYNYPHRIIALAIILLSGIICREERDVSYQELTSSEECVQLFLHDLVTILLFYKSENKLLRTKTSDFYRRFSVENLSVFDVLSAIKTVTDEKQLEIKYKELVIEEDELTKKMTKTSI